MPCTLTRIDFPQRVDVVVLPPSLLFGYAYQTSVRKVQRKGMPSSSAFLIACWRLWTPSFW